MHLYTIGLQRLTIARLTIFLVPFFLIACGGGGDSSGGGENNPPNNDPDVQTPIDSGIPIAAEFKSCDSGDNYSVNQARGYVVYGVNRYFLPEDIGTFQCSQSPTFARDANNLYWGMKQIPYTDFDSLYFIGKYYAKDDTHVFGAIEADAASFELINPERSQIHARDKSHIYLRGRFLPDADRDTFEVLDEWLARDNDELIVESRQRYFYTHDMFSSFDMTSIEALGGKFFKDTNNVIYYFNTNGAIGFREMTGADSESFQHVTGEYASDIDSYYYGTRAYASTSTGELTVLGKNLSTVGNSFYRFWIQEVEADVDTLVVLPEYNVAYDANRIYGAPSFFNLGDTLVTNTNNFRILEGGYIQTESVITGFGLGFQETPEQMTYLGGGYMSGTAMIYSGGGTRPEIDPESFELLGVLYYYDTPYIIAKDANSVFHNTSISSQIDPATYEIINRNYARDTNNVYYGTQRISNVDLTTFQVVNDIWSKDANNVYYGISSVFGNVDPTTFVAIDDEYGHDGSSYVFKRNLFGAYSPEAFVNLGGGYSRTENNFYYENIEIAGVDADSFQVLVDYPVTRYAVASDQNNLYVGSNTIAGYSLDINSFRRISSKYFGDSQNIFTTFTRASDTANFAQFGNNYFRNATEVHYYPSPTSAPQLLATADPDQFSLMAGDYYRDNDEVFYYQAVLAGLEPTSTIVELDSSNYIAHDTDTLYYQGVLMNIDVSTFEILRYTVGSVTYPSSYYYWDATRVYCGTNELTMADRASFEMGSNAVSAMDNNYTYSYCFETPR